MKDSHIAIFWFRRDLRLKDNRGLHRALSSGYKVLPLFIFDENILSKLERDDARLTFLTERVASVHEELRKANSGLVTFYGTPLEIFTRFISRHKIASVFTNSDYEPLATKRDSEIGELLKSNGIGFNTYHDQLILEPGSVLKPDNRPYTVFTPFSKRWKDHLTSGMIEEELSSELSGNFVRIDNPTFPLSLSQLGFIKSNQTVQPFKLDNDTVRNYASRRDFPELDGTTNLGPHLRFGTISIREVFRITGGLSPIFTSELIWREFFMHILFHFPNVVENSFKPEYDRIEWANNEEHFNLWCEGMTGYPFVDAGMRELKATGSMHNRVRMVTASFLVKHLLCDWRWGEAWFASKLHDFELSSNNGNWQWAAGTGCDAAPYFRIFSPDAQQQRFDRQFTYIKKWVPEFGSNDYPTPIVNHPEARERALRTYKTGLNR